MTTQLALEFDWGDAPAPRLGPRVKGHLDVDHRVILPDGREGFVWSSGGGVWGPCSASVLLTEEFESVEAHVTQLARRTRDPKRATVGPKDEYRRQRVYPEEEEAHEKLIARARLGAEDLLIGTDNRLCYGCATNSWEVECSLEDDRLPWKKCRNRLCLNCSIDGQCPDHMVLSRGVWMPKQKKEGKTIQVMGVLGHQAFKVPLWRCLAIYDFPSDGDLGHWIHNKKVEPKSTTNVLEYLTMTGRPSGHGSPPTGHGHCQIDDDTFNRLLDTGKVPCHGLTNNGWSGRGQVLENLKSAETEFLPYSPSD